MICRKKKLQVKKTRKFRVLSVCIKSGESLRLKERMNEIRERERERETLSHSLIKVRERERERNGIRPSIQICNLAHVHIHAVLT